MGFETHELPWPLPHLRFTRSQLQRTSNPNGRIRYYTQERSQWSIDGFDKGEEVCARWHTCFLYAFTSNAIFCVSALTQQLIVAAKIEEEIGSLFDFMQHIYGIFGFEFRLELSTRPDNYLGTIETWNQAEEVFIFTLFHFICLIFLSFHRLSNSNKPWTNIIPGNGTLIPETARFTGQRLILRSKTLFVVRFNVPLSNSISSCPRGSTWNTDHLTRQSSRDQSSFIGPFWVA